MTDWTGGPDPEHDNELDGGYKADWLKEQAPGHAVRGESDRPVESPAEFDNWAQDELKAAAVQEASEHLAVAGVRELSGMGRRTLARLYDLAFRHGQELTQAAAGKPLPPVRDYHITALPGSVHDRAGGALPDFGYRSITPAEAYPLTALCHECHEPVRCEHDGPWEHADGG